MLQLVFNRYFTLINIAVICCMTLLIRSKNGVLTFNTFMLDVCASVNLLMLDSFNHSKVKFIVFVMIGLLILGKKNVIKSPSQTELTEWIVHANGSISDIIVKNSLINYQLSIQLVQCASISVLFS